MTDVAYPVVYAALLSTAGTAFGATLRVVDGFDISDDPGDVMLLGVPSITDVNAITAGSFTQDPATLGTTRPRDETGTINGVVFAWNGDGNAATARSTAFGYLATLNAALRATPKLGTSLAYLVAQLSAGDVLEDKQDGANCAVSFTVAYKARI